MIAPVIQEAADEERNATMAPMSAGEPQRPSGMVAYLSSPAGAWITGAIMVVDGGEWLARPQPSAG